MGSSRTFTLLLANAFVVLGVSLWEARFGPPPRPAIARSAGLVANSSTVGFRARTVAIAASLPHPKTTLIPPPQKLVLWGPGRQERLEVVPFIEGRPNSEAREAIELFFRSRRHDAQVPIDHRLIAFLLSLQRVYPDHELSLMSGHREPGRGTSRTSFHVRGMAADIAIDGLRSRTVHRKIVELGGRGVGLYRHFVHIDMRDGPRFQWSGR